jgi:hypothetical protein
VNPGGPNMPSSSSSSGSSIATTCMSALDCPSGQVCCAGLMGTTPSTACGPGPCPVLPIIGMPVQLCQNSNECFRGQLCEKPSNGLLASVGIVICVTPQLDASTD